MPQADIDDGVKDALTTAEQGEVVHLRRENQRLEMENEMLRRAAAYFAKDSLPTDVPARGGQSQFTSVRFGERLAELGALPSVGSVRVSYDDALAETVFGLYETELIRPRGRWRNVDDVGLATLAWVDWFNNQRLHGYLGDRPPAELEAAYVATQPAPSWLEPNSPSLWRTQGGSHRCAGAQIRG